MRTTFDQWLAFQTSLLESSRSTYRTTAAGFFTWAERQRLGLTDITPAHIAAYIQFAGDSNCTNVIKGRLNLLRWFFDWTVQRGLLMTNPIQKGALPRLRRSRPDKVAFDYPQYQEVLAEVSRADSDYAAFWPGAVRIVWHTGLRCGDVAHLEWAAIDFAHQLITAWPRKKRAVNEKLTIPMEPDLAAYLATIERTDERWVLPSMRWRFDNSRTDIPHQFRVICDAVGLHKHSFHSFRHGFVTRLLNAGVDPVTIGSMTGQTVDQISEYAHISPAAKASALERSRQAMQTTNPQPQFKIA